MRRLFIAIVPQVAEADALHAYAAALPCRGGRQTARPGLHLTLAFMGDVAESRCSSLVEAFANIPFEPFVLHFDRVGAWRDGLVWVGCGQAPDALRGLVEDIRRELAELDLPVEHRAFRPHVTVWRRVRSTDRLVAPDLAWHCDGFTLIASKLAPEGPSYRALARFPRDEPAIVRLGDHDDQ